MSRKLRSYECCLKKISSDFSKLIDGVSDIDSLSPEDQEIICKIQEVAALFVFAGFGWNRNNQKGRGFLPFLNQ